MKQVNIMPSSKRIALVAHDYCKDDLLEWAEHNRAILMQHSLFATGGTGGLIKKKLNLDVMLLFSGPLGGDQQLGARIAEGKIDCLIFFWDPLEPQPHDPDVKALLRLAVLYNIPTASNRSSADFLITSPLFQGEYEQLVQDHAARIGR